ncbi:MAG: alanine--tRNA ligase, partial [Bdellovibrionales bacterium]|nr:alanine--tRNA ligase [Bdellovibrionales bacterium]
MNSKDIREKFLSFFESKGHTRVDSSSLQLNDDPTLLFPNAGMNQFKECFLGHNDRGFVRATSSQKCMRISGKHNDFENVGITPRHHTFFEMLGNFSFGDYFKKEAIEYAWEFIINILGLPKERLWVTIFEDDDEAEELWKSLTGIPAEKIVRLGESENFWSMGDTGPCGPCSEIHYFTGANPSQATRKGLEEDDGTFLEIWNLVFMQFNRDESGTLTPLPKPSVDTGMGLERVASVCQQVTSNYDSDLLRGIISVCENLSGFTYDGSSFEVRDLKTDSAYARDVAMRVIADHSRSIAFLIGDGIHPASDGRGYVLRRILRRAVRHGRALNFPEPFLAHTTGYVVDLMSDIYPQLHERKDIIMKVADAEERKFYETLDAGLTILQKEVSTLKKGECFPGKTAFLLHDTYGFPLDLTEDALKPENIKVDTNAFQQAMDAQKQRSREDRKDQDISFEAVSVSGPPTKFLGYEHLQAESKLLQLLGDNKTTFIEGDSFVLVFEETPFYGESGGQVGDTGLVTFADARLALLDTQKTASGHFLHHVKILEGSLSTSSIGERATLEVDETRRASIVRNHSATHLVHAALRHILGTHVQQAGSRVDDRSLRFDYSHFEQVTHEQLLEIQEFVNAHIRANDEVVTQVMPIDQARERGAMALFGEKYGELVRVVEIGPDSLELCGG